MAASASAIIPTSSALFVVLDMENCWLAEVEVLEHIYGTWEELVQKIREQYVSFPIIRDAVKKITQYKPAKIFVATGSNRQSLSNELSNAHRIVGDKAYENSKTDLLKMACFSSYHTLLLMVDILKIL